MPTITVSDAAGATYAGVEDCIMNAGATTANDNGGNFSLRNNGGTNTRFGLIRFTGLSSLPVGITSFDSGSITWPNGTAGGGEIWTARRCLRAWTETGATWERFDGSTLWGAAGGQQDGVDRNATSSGTTGALPASGNFVLTLNATGLADIQAWYGGTTNNGWHIMTDSDGSQPAFSSDNATDANKPYLTLTYSTGGGGGSVVTVTIML